MCGSFAIPWQDGLLLGTTDHPYEGDPADVAPDPGDERQILAEAGLSLTPATIDPAASGTGSRACACCRWQPGRPARRRARWC